jgi:hypothetical protein
MLRGPCILPTPDRKVSFVVDTSEVEALFYGVVMEPPKGTPENGEYLGCDLLHNVPALCAEFFDGGAVAAFRLGQKLLGPYP